MRTVSNAQRQSVQYLNSAVDMEYVAGEKSEISD
jgi:hypothetical protein